MLKKLMITTALSGLMIGAAVAQGSTPADRPAVNPPAAATNQSDTRTAPVPSTASSVKFINSQQPDQFLATKFKGTDVIGANEEKIGDVSDILFDKDGKVLAYIVSVGGFLGIGSKQVALEPAAFQVVPGDKSKNESDKLRLSMTKDQLTQAANFEAYHAPRTTTGMAPNSSRPGPVLPAPVQK